MDDDSYYALQKKRDILFRSDQHICLYLLSLKSLESDKYSKNISLLDSGDLNIVECTFVDKWDQWV